MHDGKFLGFFLIKQPQGQSEKKKILLEYFGSPCSTRLSTPRSKMMINYPLVVLWIGPGVH